MDRSPLETHHHHQSSSSPTKDHAPNKVTLPFTTDPPSASNPPSKKVWLIFGATGHMGRSLVKTALQHNDLVSAVGQSHTDILSSLQTSHAGKSSSFLAQLCDVRIRPSVDTAIKRTITHFGRLDIIANCTGYGVIGACEDQDEYEIRNQFETNFMGTLNILQLSLPYFRTREEGRYLIFSSTSGALGVPGLGPYCASKYAVEGLIESMLYEVDGFGIRATLVEPSHLRRDDVHRKESGAGKVNGRGGGAGDETEKMPLYNHFRVLKPSPPYATADAPAKHAQRLLQWIGDHQPTSVVKAAELSWQLGHCSFPPLRLLLGTYAVESVRDRLKCVIEEIEDWKYLSFAPAMGEEEKEGEDGKDEGEEDDEGDDDGEKERDAEEEDDIDVEEDEDDDRDADGEIEDADKDKVQLKQERQTTKDVEMDDA